MAKQEEKIHRTLKDEKEPQSRAKRVRMLLKKNQAVFKSKQAMTDFAEPVLFLIRKSKAVEFFEDASKGTFVFKHSDGKEREIYLEPSQQVSFDYGRRKFRGYICNEDSPLPLPENPIITVDTTNMIIEKSMMDTRKLDEKKEALKVKTMKILIWAALGGLLLLILWKTHAFERIIGLVTGQKYVEPTTIVQTTEAVSNSNILDITGKAFMGILKW